LSKKLTHRLAIIWHLGLIQGQLGKIIEAVSMNGMIPDQDEKGVFFIKQIRGQLTEVEKILKELTDDDTSGTPT